MSDVTFANDPDFGITEAIATIDNGDFGTRTIRFETGQLARQAGGSVTAYLDDDTMMLATTTASNKPREGFDFFPLTVDVEERMYAAGRIPGSFFRREGRPSTEAILACRLIDRPLRPTFVKGLRNEVQVIVTVMSMDPEDMYDVVAINASSAAMGRSSRGCCHAAQWPACVRSGRWCPHGFDCGRQASQGPVGGFPDPHPVQGRVVRDRCRWPNCYPYQGTQEG